MHRVDTAKATEVPTVDGLSVASYPNLIHYDKLDKAGTSRPGNRRTCSQRRFARASGPFASVRQSAAAPSASFRERLLLVHGWAQTWYQWRLVMPELARDFQVVAVDQRGIGLSDKPPDGYDTGTLASDLVALMEGLGHQRFALVGFDTGVAIAYALAADHRDRVERLVVGEGPLPGPLNERLWHIGFNRTAEVNERLVKGREDIYIGNEYAFAAVKLLPNYAVNYIDILRSHKHALRGSFGWYRALDATIAQEAQRKTRRLTLPVLAIGGQYSGGERVADGMKLAADDVQTVVIPGAGDWVAEEAPQELLAALTTFLAPYRPRARASLCWS